jgi:molybdate transport system substrate-binding protein
MKPMHILTIIFWLFISPAQAAEPITVAVAANVKYAFKDIAIAFTKQTGIEVKSVISSSGKLTAQITHGAPYDVFLSADIHYPASLYQSGFALSYPKVYANGALVLWTSKKLDLAKGIAITADPSVINVAIANPKLAPYGRESLSALNYYQLTKSVMPKLVYAESISQVNQYIDIKSVDIGFTAKSVVLSPELKGKGAWVDVPAESYAPIEQGMVILKYGAKHHHEATQQFYDFMLSDKAREILAQYGYKLPS